MTGDGASAPVPSSREGLGRLARELDGAAGDAWRDEAEAAEHDAAVAAARRRDIVDVLTEHAGTGAAVQATVGGRRFAGSLRAVTGELAELTVGGDRVVVRAAAAVWRLAPSAPREPGGPPRGAGAGRGRPLTAAGAGLRSLAVALEMDRTEIRVGVNGEEARGRIVATGRDHLALDTAGGRLVAPFGAVDYLVVAAG